MGIKHKAVKAIGEEGHSTEWNDEHKIDSDVNFAGYSGVNVGEPAAPSDIATKNYVDVQAGEIPSALRTYRQTTFSATNISTYYKQIIS
ncbi:unnamed protein product, partial [marine sediment metagenome]